jgi:hypothetical protein
MKHGGLLRRMNSGLTAGQWLTMWRQRYYGDGHDSAYENEIILDIRVMRPEHERKAA